MARQFPKSAGQRVLRRPLILAAGVARVLRAGEAGVSPVPGRNLP